MLASLALALGLAGAAEVAAARGAYGQTRPAQEMHAIVAQKQGCGRGVATFAPGRFQNAQRRIPVELPRPLCLLAEYAGGCPAPFFCGARSACQSAAADPDSMHEYVPRRAPCAGWRFVRRCPRPFGSPAERRATPPEKAARFPGAGSWIPAPPPGRRVAY